MKTAISIRQNHSELNRIISTHLKHYLCRYIFFQRHLFSNRQRKTLFKKETIVDTVQIVEVLCTYYHLYLNSGINKLHYKIEITRGSKKKNCDEKMNSNYILSLISILKILENQHTTKYLPFQRMVHHEKYYRSLCR